MTNLKCPCGKTFRVKPEMAGRVVTAPCCQAKVKVPGAAAPRATVPPASRGSDRIKVQCPCGQAMIVQRPVGMVEVACPACKQPMRLGTAPAAAPAVNQNAGLFDGLPPASTQAGRRSGAPGFRTATSPPMRHPKATAPQRKASAPKQRLPRLGVLEDDFGVPLLIVGGLIFLSVFVGLGVYLHGQASENMAKAAASEAWLAADGEIKDSGYTVRGKKATETITVRYTYLVGPTSYTGNTFSFEKQDSYSAGTSKRRLEPYPPGATCKVYYNPDNLAESVLIKGAQSSNQLFYWLGIASIICGIVLLIDCLLGSVNAHRFPPKRAPEK